MKFMEKKEVTRAAREAALACFDTLEFKPRRPNLANSWIDLGEVFLCFNVQHTQWKVAGRFKFCINFGFLPKLMFEENWNGLMRSYPQEINCIFRSRLNPKGTKGDYWWEVSNVEQMTKTLSEIVRATELLKSNLLPKMKLAKRCLEQQNTIVTTRSSPRLKELAQWNERFA